jgi:hypothetical protein
MIVVDRSRLKAEWRNLDMMPKLEEFLEKVALLKPLCKFEVSDKDVSNIRYRDDPKDSSEEWKHKQLIKRIRVYENGERIGSIGIGDRWRRSGTEEVYEVEGFRIQKFRGNQNVTQTKDLKVAVREAKKVFTPREDQELKDLLGNTVNSNLNSVHGSLANALRWDFNTEAEICFYAMQGYMARRHGDKECSMPATPTTIRNLAEHDKKCEAYGATHELYAMLQAKKGLAIRTNHDKSIAVYNYETDSITKFQSYDDLPEGIACKYAVFNVLDVNEPQPHIGIKFQEGYAFIAL